jgi:hypothetical protein
MKRMRLRERLSLATQLLQKAGLTQDCRLHGRLHGRLPNRTGAQVMLRQPCDGTANIRVYR